MPQNAAFDVMRSLQTLMKATGPQDEAKLGPTTLVMSQIESGVTRAITRTTTPTASIMKRLNRSMCSSLQCRRPWDSTS